MIKSKFTIEVEGDRKPKIVDITDALENNMNFNGVFSVKENDIDPIEFAEFVSKNYQPIFLNGKFEYYMSKSHRTVDTKYSPHDLLNLFLTNNGN